MDRRSAKGLPEVPSENGRGRERRRTNGCHGIPRGTEREGEGQRPRTDSVVQTPRQRYRTRGAAAERDPGPPG